MIKAQLINVGRSNINKTIEVKDVKSLHKEIGKYVISKNWGMEEGENENEWEITSGWRTVGKVIIIEN